MSETGSITLYDRDREIKELRASLTALDAQVRQLQNIVNSQATALRLAMAASLHRIADAMADDQMAEAPAPDNAKWAQWKSRLSPRAGEVIDFLLVVERATIRQIGAAIKLDPRTASKGPIYEMNKIGLLVKNGDAYSLKQL